MEYERIHKAQTGMISPSKLRMKLMGPHHHKKKEESNCNSSRTSPSKLADSEFAKNSLLASQDSDYDGEVAVPYLETPSQSFSQCDQNSCESKVSLPKENGDATPQQTSKGDGGNSIHPMRMLEDENLDYDSNASSSSFEFHKGERLLQNRILRSISRPMPYKWNDAEKWIMNKQNGQLNYPRKHSLQNQNNRVVVTNMVRVAPEFASYDQKLPINRAPETKRVDFCVPALQMGNEKFSFAPSGSYQASKQYGGNLCIDTCPQSKDLKECTKSLTEESEGTPSVRAVSMRDMGTEMTPMTSQEPSRTASPLGAMTPFRSPTSSIPSTPRGGAPAPTPMEHATNEESQRPTNNCKRELSEEEMKVKTRREIVALGVQLGKMNIAAWASKDEKEKNKDVGQSIDPQEHKCIDFEKRAAAWEEAEKSKHMARFTREEIKIQAWESQQKAKLEAEMQKIEAQVEEMRAQARAKILKRIAMARQRSEEKRVAAEVRKNRDAERTAAQAEYIRQTGRMPSSHYMCCGW